MVMGRKMKAEASFAKGHRSNNTSKAATYCSVVFLFLFSWLSFHPQEKVNASLYEATVKWPHHRFLISDFPASTFYHGGCKIIPFDFLLFSCRDVDVYRISSPDDKHPKK
jgi:hypothetical protein